MPELPDVVVYLESLEARVKGRVLRGVRLLNPFVLRTAVPPLAVVEGKQVTALRPSASASCSALTTGFISSSTS